MSALATWWKRWFRPGPHRPRAAGPAVPTGPAAIPASAREGVAAGSRRGEAPPSWLVPPPDRIDPRPLRLSPTTDGAGVEIARGGEFLALVRPPPGFMVLEAVAVRSGEGDERLVGALFDLSERRGSVVWWRATDDRHASADMETLLVGEPESVLWRLCVRDGDLHVRDTRHGVLYRMRRGGAGAEVVPEARENARQLR